MDMTPSRTTRFIAWMTIASFVNSTVYAADVDVANVPLVSMSTKLVRPNVMFILDDSTSMTWDYMPDECERQQHQALLPQLRLQQDLFQPDCRLRHAASMRTAPTTTTSRPSPARAGMGITRHPPATT